MVVDKYRRVRLPVRGGSCAGAGRMEWTTTVSRSMSRTVGVARHRSSNSVLLLLLSMLPDQRWRFVGGPSRVDQSSSLWSWRPQRQQMVVDKYRRVRLPVRGGSSAGAGRMEWTTTISAASTISTGADRNADASSKSQPKNLPSFFDYVNALKFGRSSPRTSKMMKALYFVRCNH
jgi:hypothetical protein